MANASNGVYAELYRTQTEEPVMIDAAHLVTAGQ